jgi:hypothetical protein
MPGGSVRRPLVVWCRWLPHALGDRRTNTVLRPQPLHLVDMGHPQIVILVIVLPFQFSTLVLPFCRHLDRKLIVSEVPIIGAAAPLFLLPAQSIASSLVLFAQRLPLLDLAIGEPVSSNLKWRQLWRLGMWVQDPAAFLAGT